MTIAVGSLLLSVPPRCLRTSILRAGGCTASRDEDAIRRRDVARHAPVALGPRRTGFVMRVEIVSLEGTQGCLLLSLGLSSCGLTAAGAAVVAAVSPAGRGPRERHEVGLGLMVVGCGPCGCGVGRGGAGRVPVGPGPELSVRWGPSWWSAPSSASARSAAGGRRRRAPTRGLGAFGGFWWDVVVVATPGRAIGTVLVVPGAWGGAGVAAHSSSGSRPQGSSSSRPAASAAEPARLRNARPLPTVAPPMMGAWPRRPDPPRRFVRCHTACWRRWRARR